MSERSERNEPSVTTAAGPGGPSDPTTGDPDHGATGSPAGTGVVVDPATKAEKKRRRAAAWERRKAERPSAAERATLGAAVLEHAAPLLDALPPHATVLTYESWASEPPTGPLNEALVAAGHRVLVPITLPDLDLDWRPLGSPDDRASGLGHGVLADVDLVLAPGTLVDRTGTRLGQGGGCYDRTLPRLRPGTPVVAVLFDGELVDEPLPRDPHDMPVDAVLQPAGLTRLHD